MLRAIARLTYRYIGQRIMLQDWQHIAIAISKKHACQRGMIKADFDEVEGDDAEQYEIPDDLAASHTGQIAALYGVTINVLKCLTADFLEIFGQVSHQWHAFLKLDMPDKLDASSSSKRIS